MGFIVKAVGSVVKAVVGIAGKIVGGILGPVIGLFKPKTKAKASSNLRLNKDLTPEAYRKIVFGKTAAALDIRYWQVWGATNTNYDEVIALASHTINSVLELYFENELAVDAAGVVQPNWVGTITRDFRVGAIGQTAMSVGSGTQWNASSVFTGVAHMKLAWTPTEAKLPNGIPNRYTQVVEGAFVYDPRRDSTKGGSGSHRIDNQTTWSYATLDSFGVPIGRNNALQVLWYLLGWYIPNPVTGELILVAGRGVDPSDINLDTFIQAANDCEAAGYYTDCILSTEDTHTSNEDKLTAGGLIGQLIDTGGLWCYYANVNDTADVAVNFTDNDVFGNIQWNDFRPISEQFQQVGGKFIDPSINSLFQLNGYPIVRDTTYENQTGLKRRKVQDFEVVQDIMLAQKLARLILNMGQYQAEFSGSFFYKALRAQVWSNVSWTSERFGWTKLFKVYRHDITDDNGIQMLLRETHASIWNAGSVVAPAAPSAGVKYDPRQKVPVTGLARYSTTIAVAGGAAVDGCVVDWDDAPANVNRTEIRYKLNSQTFWQSLTASKLDSFIVIAPLVSAAVYNIEVRHISIHEVPGDWLAASNFTVGSATNIPWSSVTGNGRPEDNATQNEDGDNMIPDPINLTQVNLAYGAALATMNTTTRLAAARNITYTTNNCQGNWCYDKQIPCSPGETYYYYAVVLRNAGTPAGEYIIGGVNFQRADGGYVSNLQFASMQFFGNEGSTNTWYVKSASFVVPANIAFVVPYFIRPNAGTTGGAASGIFRAGEPYLGRHDKGATYGSPSGSPVDLGNITGKPTNGSNVLPTNWNIGIKSLNQTGFTLSDTDNTGTVTINIAASTWQLDNGTLINYPAGSIPGLAYATRYYIYRNDPALNGGTSYASTTDLANAVGAGKVYLGYWLTRASGGATGGGGGGGSEYCVTCDMQIITDRGIFAAEDLLVGDVLEVLNKDLTTTDYEEISYIQKASNECVSIKTENGAELELAINTPMIDADGRWELAANAHLMTVPALIDGKLEWSKVIDVEYVGIKSVMVIVANNAIFAAGKDKRKLIFSHNIGPVKP